MLRVQTPKVIKLVRKKAIADWVVEAYAVSKRRAYRLMQLSW